MPHSGPPPSTLTAQLARVSQRLTHVWKKEIWASAHLQDTSPRGWLFACLRVISITGTVFIETKVPSRAAALSFSSLLSLGPLIAIAVLVGGFILGKNDDPNLVANQVGALLEQVAPQLRSLQTANNADATIGEAVNPELVSMLNGFITSARSGYGGVFGALSLIVIVLLIFYHRHIIIISILNVIVFLGISIGLGLGLGADGGAPAH